MRSILKASAIMGVSSVVTIALSVVRVKFVAVILGPEGMGLLGLLVTGLAVGVTGFSLGLANSGVRYVASAQAEGDEALGRTRVALVWGSQALGLLGGLLVVLFSEPLASALLANPDLGSADKTWWMVWLGIALWASVVSGGQLAVINGMRRIADLAKAKAMGAALGTVATIIAVLYSGQAGLIAALVATPLTTWLVAWWFSRSLPPAAAGAGVRERLAEGLKLLRPMVGLGLVFSASLLLTGATQFLTRLLIDRNLGLEAAGHFQAAWGVSNMYLGFVTGALAAEYYPRISAIAADKRALNEAVNNQIRIILFLAGPVILGIILFSPLVVSLLYSAEFQETVPLLRWQLVGDVLKVASWAVGFLLLAREARRRYFVAELSWNALYLGSLAVLLPAYGLVAAGGIYAFCYLAYLLLVLAYAYRETVFRPGKAESMLIAGLFVTGLGVRLLSELGPVGIAFAGMLVTAVVIYSFYQVQQSTGFRLKSLVSGGRT